MDNNEVFFIDILNILPNNIDCYIGTYELEDSLVLELMQDYNKGDFDKYIHLDQKSKKTFIERLKKATISEYFQNLEIYYNNILLFRGYDSIESGILSNTIYIPQWFKDKYKEDWDYTISSEW